MRSIVALLTAVVLAGTARLSAAAPAMEPVRIPGGSWRSILPTGTKESRVTVKPFLIDRAPVTNAQFLAFVRANPQWQRGRVPAALADPGYLMHWRAPEELGPIAAAQQPVTGISWFAAQAYCEARGARLPSWYEWELTSAADETTPDARTNPVWQQRILSWYAKPSGQALPPVAAERANLYGVHDLHGLVWEWVEDFNALMVSGDSRERGDPDRLKFCGSGAMALESPDNYAVAMRIALLSSLEARSTTVNLGFRCAQNDSRGIQ